jgi:hypothetical protein
MLQLLGGPVERADALRCAASLLAPNGRVAASIVEGVPEGGGDLAQPLPDVAEIEGWVYSSLPLEIFDEGETMRIVRLRQVVSPDGDLQETMDETVLAALDSDLVELEALPHGLRPAARLEVPASDLHVGSTVVVLEAA